MSGYTKLNLVGDVENSAEKFGMGDVLAAHFVRDDLAWLRQAYDEPEENGLTPLKDTAAVAAWEPDQACTERLYRLRERRVLDAAGFLLHTSDDDEAVA